MPSAPILTQQRLLREAFLDYLPHPSLLLKMAPKQSAPSPSQNGEVGSQAGRHRCNWTLSMVHVSITPSHPDRSSEAQGTRESGLPLLCPHYPQLLCSSHL